MGQCIEMSRLLRGVGGQLSPHLLIDLLLALILEMRFKEEDDEILRQLHTTQARISIWSFHPAHIETH